MKKKTTTQDMTSGNILGQLVLFALPLIVGNIFQLLYNTVDTYVVGNYVGKEALAAVGSTAMIINMVVFFFNGLSIGAGVVISRYFGARQMEKLHDAIETTMAMTFILCIFFTILGTVFVEPMLVFMSTPKDVIPEATVYLRIYMAGVSGVMIYNMASGILRAVGDTKSPLYILVFTSIMNVVLDLFFVLVVHMGVAGVALATIISQFFSAIVILIILSKADDIYKLIWRDLHIDKNIMGKILVVGLPTAIQSLITAFSNIFVQSYINVFGSSVVAGWSCFNKVEQFIMLPMDSMAKAATTFVSQNMGAGDEKRANTGTITAVLTTVLFTFCIFLGLIRFAEPVTGVFSKDAEVIRYGAMFVRVNVFFCLMNCVNHTLAGALRGHGDSKGPMIIMLSCFVVIRQIYLFVVTRYVVNTPAVVGFGYPVGWTACCIVEVTYFFYKTKWKRQKAFGKTS